MNLVTLFLTTMLAENIILYRFLGICPFIGTSSKEKTGKMMGLCVILVVMISSVITYLLYHYVLVKTDTTYLKTLLFILVIASLVQMVEMIIKKKSPNLYEKFGIYLPLITTNCSVLGINLLNVSNDYSFIEMLVFSFGSSLGFFLIIYIFSTIREYLATKKSIPASFKGEPIAFITAAIIALIFTRYGL